MEATWIKKMKSPPILVEVTQRRNEPTERLIKRFMRKVKKEKIIEDYLDKTSYFKSKPTKRKEKSKRAKIRAAREARKALRKKRR